MNLFDVLSSPAAHSTYLAGVVYAGAATLDRKMRREALKDIADFINRTSIFPDSHIVADFIYREFRLMFGERHFSIKCITRSIIASFIVISGILVFMLLLDTEEFRIFISLTHHNWRAFFGTLLAGISFSLVPDYVSLLKGRVLLKYMAFRPTALKIGLVCIADIVASVFVSLLTLAIIFVSIQYIFGIGSIDPYYMFAEIFLGEPPITTDYPSIVKSINILFAVTVVGTMMTSIWTVLSMSSCLTIRVLSSINILLRVVRWMFDVETHPVEVLGMPAAGFVWVISFVVLII